MLYSALSHRWTSTVPKLTEATLQQMLSDMSDEVVPKHYRDVFQLARALGFRYLWIDSLCIIQEQDSYEDWLCEAKTMQDVYANACLTFSICWSSEGWGCIPSGRSGQNRNRIFISTDSWTSVLVHSLNLSRRKSNATVLSPQLWDSAVTNSPLNQRGWVVQERILSRRLLYLGNDQLFWECDKSTACEMLPQQITKHGPNYLGCPDERSAVLPRPCVDHLGKDPHGFWKVIVSQYSRTNLTFDSDRLVAISAIAKMVSVALKDEYLAGIWKNSVILDLLWEVDGDPRPADASSTYTAPTWSWAGYQGPVKYLTWGYDGAHLATLNVASIVPKGGTAGDPFGKLDSAAIELTCFQIPVFLVPDYSRSPTFVLREWGSQRTGVKVDFNRLRDQEIPNSRGRYSSGLDCILDDGCPWSADTKNRYLKCIFVPLVYRDSYWGCVGLLLCLASPTDANTQPAVRKYTRLGILDLPTRSSWRRPSLEQFMPSLVGCTNIFGTTTSRKQVRVPKAFNTIRRIAKDLETSKEQGSPSIIKSEVVWGNIYLI